MKKLLFILLTLITSYSFAQVKVIKVKGTPGAYNFSKSGDSIIFYVNGVRQALSVGTVTDLSNYYTKDVIDDSLSKKRSIYYYQVLTAQLPLKFTVFTPDSAKIFFNLDSTIITSDSSVPTSNAVKTYVDASSSGSLIPVVSTLASMQSYSGTSSVIQLTDTLQGGLFVYSSTGTANNGIVFTATGKGSGFWVRQYDKSKGVSVDWWGSRDEVAVRSAISAAGTNGVVNFTPNKIYIQKGRIQPQLNQTFNGNNATLQRANETIVTLTAISLITDSTITVSSVPSNWNATNGYIHLFTDTTDFSSSGALSIVSIVGNVIKFSTATGGLANPDGTHTQITQWAIGTKAHLIYNQVDDNGNFVNFSITNLTFDGNKTNNGSNHSWRINTTITIKGNQGQPSINNCSFINIPNENIIGHGFKILNNYAHNLNGSFVHLSAVYGNNPPQIPSIITGNITDSTNQIPNSVGAHSQGCITYSNTSGYVTIANNRFKNGLDGIFGTIQSGSGSNGGVRNMTITGNYAENFSSIFNTAFADPTSQTYKFGHIFIDDNTLNNCGVNDWSSYQTNIDKGDSIMIGTNFPVGGTVWIIPIQNSDSLQRNILNNATSTAQKAAINITGNIKANSFVKPSGTSSQFLKADGSVDATTYSSDANAVHKTGTETVAGSKTFTSPLSINPVTNVAVNIDGNITLLDTTSTNARSVNVYSNTPSVIQYAIRPSAGEGAGAVFSFSNGGAGIHFYDKTKLWDNGVLATLHAGAGNTTISYQYFGSGSDADFTHNNLRLYPDKTVALMTVNDAVGNFLTLNTSTNKVQSRTPSETLTDIGALAVLAPYVAKATSYTATATDRTIEVTATGQTITLPTSVGITGRTYIIVYTAASGTATIATTSSQTFLNITGTPTTLTLSAPAAGTTTSYTVQSNGAAWVVTAKVKND